MVGLAAGVFALPLPSAPLSAPGPLFAPARLALVLGAGFLAGPGHVIARRCRLGQCALERRHLPAQLLCLFPFPPRRLGVLAEVLDLSVRGLDIMVGLAAGVF